MHAPCEGRQHALRKAEQLAFGALEVSVRRHKVVAIAQKGEREILQRRARVVRLDGALFQQSQHGTQVEPIDLRHGAGKR